MHIQKRINQAGFLHASMVLALIVVAVIGFAGGSVYSSHKKKQDSARIAAEEKQRADKAVVQKQQISTATPKTVEIPAAEAEKKIVEPTPEPKTSTATAVPKTTTQPTYTKFDIPSATSQVDATAIVVTASLGKSLSGVCAVSIYGVSPTATFSGYKTSLWYETNFASQDTCSVTIPKEKLTGTGTYKYQMYYIDNYSNKTLKGVSAYFNFDL